MKRASSQRRVTQQAVAKAANVSQTLVSLVLSGAQVDVAEKTRQQILDTAKRLGYVVRRKRSTGSRAKAIAYIRPVNVRGEETEEWIYEGYDDYYDKLQNLLLEEAFRLGYSLIVRPDEGPAALTQWLTEWDVEGVIWHGVSDLAGWIAARYPMVQLHRQSLVEADAISTNQEEIIDLSVRHLYEQGHRQILFITPTPAKGPLQQLRIKRFYELLDELKLHSWKEAFEEHWKATENSTIHERAVYLARITREEHPNRPTAIIVGDHSAYYFMHYFQRHGVQVPEQISIVGIDNITPSGFTYPPLTTIDHCRAEIARQALVLLDSRIRKPQRPFCKVYITPKLIVRESVARVSPLEMTQSTPNSLL